MTEEEARSCYDRARYNRNAAQNRMNDYIRLRNARSNVLSSQKTEKINLDKRLAGLNKAIKFFEGILSNKFEQANIKANNAQESYVPAVHCTGSNAIQNASISSAFFTSSVQNEANTNNAYQACLNEKNYVSNKIEELNQSIWKLNNEISGLTADINRCRGLISQYSDQMQYYGSLF